MPQMSPLFWVLLMMTFILVYSICIIFFYFKNVNSLNLTRLNFSENLRFNLIF